MAFDLDPSYKQVPERIADFLAKHPEGCLRPVDPAQPYRIESVGDRIFIVYAAAAYRHPEDPCPGIGVAWEPFPGKTPYTRESELMNAETSAWGRAIVAVLASQSKAVASAEDVRNRRPAPPHEEPCPERCGYTGPSKGAVAAHLLESHGWLREGGKVVPPPAAPTSAAGAGDGVERASAPSSPHGDAGGGTAAAAGAPPTPATRAKLFALLPEIGVTDATLHAWAGDVLGRTVGTFGTLTQGDYHRLIEAAEAAPKALRLGVDG